MPSDADRAGISLSHLHEVAWSTIDGAHVRVRIESADDPLDPDAERTTSVREGELVGRAEGWGLYYDSDRGQLIPDPIGPKVYLDTPEDTTLEVATDKHGNELLEFEAAEDSDA